MHPAEGWKQWLQERHFLPPAGNCCLSNKVQAEEMQGFEEAYLAIDPDKKSTGLNGSLKPSGRMNKPSSAIISFPKYSFIKET